MAPRRRVDPVLNERNRRKLARVFREVLANEPYPDRATIPMLLDMALRDAGYWERGEEFAFVANDETGEVTLCLPWHKDDGTPMGNILIALDPGDNLDEWTWEGLERRSQRLEDPGLGDLH